MINAVCFDVLHRPVQNLIVATYNGLKLTALLLRQFPIRCHHVKNGRYHRQVRGQSDRAAMTHADETLFAGDIFEQTFKQIGGWHHKSR